jgi:hypothetical protein
MRINTINKHFVHNGKRKRIFLVVGIGKEGNKK